MDDMDDIDEPQPTLRDMDRLLSFRAQLYADDGTPQRRAKGSSFDPDSGELDFDPHYDDVLREFIHVASQPCWQEPDYLHPQPREILSDPARIAAATLPEFRALITYIVRGERFSDGHVAAYVTDGSVAHLLQRLVQLRQDEEARQELWRRAQAVLDDQLDQRMRPSED